MFTSLLTFICSALENKITGWMLKGFQMRFKTGSTTSKLCLKKEMGADVYQLTTTTTVRPRNKPSNFGVVLVTAAVVLCSTGGNRMIYDTFTLNSPSFLFTVTFWIAETVSSSAASMLNFKTTSKIRLPHLRKIIVDKIETKQKHTWLQLIQKYI